MAEEPTLLLIQEAGYISCGDILEVVGAHVAVPAVAIHAFSTSISVFLARIKELGASLPVHALIVNGKDRVFNPEFRRTLQIDGRRWPTCLCSRPQGKAGRWLQLSLWPWWPQSPEGPAREAIDVATSCTLLSVIPNR